MHLDDLDYLFRFIGYGDPYSRLWFIGIEEGGVPGDIRRNSHRDFSLGGESVRYDPGFPPREDRQHNWVWSTVEEMAQACGTAGRSEPYFMGNIAPVARPHVSNQHQGIDAAAYAKRIREERVNRLVSATRERPGRVMVFHGIAGWRTYDVDKAFGADAGITRDAETGLRISESNRLVFAPTFSWGQRHFSQKRRDRLAGLLEQWLRPDPASNRG